MSWIRIYGELYFWWSESESILSFLDKPPVVVWCCKILKYFWDFVDFMSFLYVVSQGTSSGLGSFSISFDQIHIITLFLLKIF